MKPEISTLRRAALLDVDRTILRSEAFSRHIYSTLGALGVSASILDQAKREQAASVNNAFDYIARVYDLIGGQPFGVGTLWQMYDLIKRQHRVEGGWSRQFSDDIVVEDTRELIGAMNQADIEAVLCTSGGEMTQRIKLMVLGDVLELDLPWVIVGPDQQHKASDIAETYDHQRQVFDFTRYANKALASSQLNQPRLQGIQMVEVIDDKWMNLANVPDGVPVRGWLAMAAELPDDGADRLSLAEIADRLA